MKNPLVSPYEYSLFIHQLPDDYPLIIHSSLIYIPMGIKIGRTEGMILFPDDIILCVKEFLNFELQVIEGYGYEVSRSRVPDSKRPGTEEYCRASFPEKEKLWWYDSFPHPNDLSLSLTHPHHKHIHPDIKHLKNIIRKRFGNPFFRKENNKMNTVEELRSKAVPLLRPYARKISLFGSFARQESSEKSDIDLLVELKPPAQRPVLGLRWFGLEGELGHMMGRKIELFSETELSPHLKFFAERDTVLLYEEN